MQYDVVFYTPDRHQRANELIKRLPPEEAAERRKRLGVSVRFGVGIPNVDGAPSGVSGNMYITLQYGARAVRNDRIADDVTLEILEPGLVVGNFKEGTLDKPEYVKEAVAERAAEKAHEESLKANAEADREINARYAGTLIKTDLQSIFDLCKVEKELDDKRAKKLASRVEKMARGGNDFAMALFKRWTEALELGEPVEPLPPEIADDPEACAARLMANFDFHRKDRTRKQ